MTLTEVNPARLRELPGVVDVDVVRTRVLLATARPDDTVAALYRSGLDPTDLQISGASLEDALISLTRAAGPPGTAAAGPNR